MPQVVTNNAMLMCSFGMAPGILSILPEKRVNGSHNPVANIMDNKPMVNIKPFGMCTSLSNPQVSAATSAASGVLTPQPSAPWSPGSPTVKVGGQPALTSTCQLTCNWAGVITVSQAGQMTVDAP
jgi:hypothetical protein